MTEPTFTLLINAVATPILVILTLWVRSVISQKDRQEMREDGFIAGLEKRIASLEKEVREVRIELKNRDAEYLSLYKEYTTLKAKHEVLSVDHDELKKKYEATVKELNDLRLSIQATAVQAAEVIKAIK